MIQQKTEIQNSKARLLTKKDDTWKHSNLSFLDKISFLPTSIDRFEENAPLENWKSLADILIANGQIYLSKNILMHEGMNVKLASELSNDELKHTQLQLDKNSSLLDLSALDSFIILKIKSDSIIDKPIKIVHFIKSKNSLAETSTLLIFLDQNSKASIYESFKTDTTHPCLFNTQTHIVLNQNSSLAYGLSQNIEKHHYFNNEMFLYQNRLSHLELLQFSSGSHWGRLEINNCLENDAQCLLTGLSLTSGGQQLELVTNIDHKSPMNFSQQLFKNILSENSKNVFNGKIFVRPKAQKIIAKQLNKALLLGKNAEMISQPQLEIEADDVQCTHGATVGQINLDELFYLQSRGLNTEQAQFLLCQGFAEEVFSKIENKELAREMRLNVRSKIQSLFNTKQS